MIQYMLSEYLQVGKSSGFIFEMEALLSLTNFFTRGIRGPFTIRLTNEVGMSLQLIAEITSNLRQLAIGGVVTKGHLTILHSFRTFAIW